MVEFEETVQVLNPSTSLLYAFINETWMVCAAGGTISTDPRNYCSDNGITLEEFAQDAREELFMRIEEDPDNLSSFDLLMMQICAQAGGSFFNEEENEMLTLLVREADRRESHNGRIDLSCSDSNEEEMLRSYEAFIISRSTVLEDLGQGLFLRLLPTGESVITFRGNIYTLNQYSLMMEQS